MSHYCHIRIYIIYIIVNKQNHKFLARNVNILTLSGLSDALLCDTTPPDILNKRSEGELVAQTDKYFLATLDNKG